ncbi:strictosidine synthase [Leptospira broomii serovar Hurstbridge str. 5399]|uniref:Strictosidine synthase n=1 Tax=Leptospira broomii serovar Hurstbridge str. 5399 TaxID=1049789 RepID=T0FB29_9LEPT|nr:SMP-30/gluconolactonase/LRE family protein [Leptospira broomii]EQA44782.1 strictosidine synthase [Leptospira broomii serovar Hurstbridge str. 5399]
MLRSIYLNPFLRIVFPILSVISLLFVSILVGWNKTDPEFYSVDSPIPQGEDNALFFSEAVHEGKISEPFAIALDSKGWIYTGSSDGNIYRIKTDGKVEVFARTSGRPLGLAFDGKGNLVTCLSGVGLAFYDPQGKENILARQDEQGNTLGNLYGLDIASDGTVYFTEVSRKFSYDSSYLEELESRPNGRILAYKPKDQSITVVLDEVYAPTGIALSSREEFLVYAEKYRHRVTRFWLKGKKTGKEQFFITHLPGSPALIHSDKKDAFWIALSAPRHKLIDKIQEKPILKKYVAALPVFFKPKEGTFTYILGMNEAGDVTFALTDSSSSRVGSTTAAIEFGRGLLLAGNASDKIWKWKFETLESFF